MSKFLQLEFGTGRFYEYSGTEKEGYEKYETSTGKVSYRKYYRDGVSGILESVSIYDGKFGKQISMTIKDDSGDFCYVPIDIKDQKGNVSTFAEALIKLLPNLEKGTESTVTAYNFTPEGEKYRKIGLNIVSGGEKVSWAIKNAYYKDGKLVEGDIPAVKWTKNSLGESQADAASLQAKNDYLLEVLVKETDRLKYVKSETSEKPENAYIEASSVSAEQDDLPF